MKNTASTKNSFENQVLKIIIPESLLMYLDIYLKECIEILANCDYLDRQIAQSIISIVSTNLLLDDLNSYICSKSKIGFDNFVFSNLKTIIQEKLHEVYIEKTNCLDLLNFNSLNNSMSINIEILFNELKIELLKLERFLRRKSIEQNKENCPIKIQANVTQELLNQMLLLSQNHSRLIFVQPIMGSSDIFNEFVVKEITHSLRRKLNLQFNYSLNKNLINLPNYLSVFDLTKSYQLIAQLCNLFNQIIHSIDCTKILATNKIEEFKSFNQIYSAEICANNSKLSLVSNQTSNLNFISSNYLTSILIEDLNLTTKYLKYINIIFK